MNLWVDTGIVVSQDDLTRFVEKASSFVLPRVFALWGDNWADIDGNGKVSVLISRSINDAGRAIGFFNPADLYERVDDIASNSWNPVSNEMDIVYLANPFGDSEEFAYSLSSVLATLAHETYHLIMYSHKPYFLEQAGDTSSSGEELFLDEGLAPLTESLVGLGVSGGNIAFLSRYLENTSLVSAKGCDLDGQLDSVGKRGMMSAFLSWIFWQQGGATWDETDPSTIVDNGSIAFLWRMLRSNDRGWDCIGTAAGQLADTLLVEWFHNIEQEDRKELVVITDAESISSVIYKPNFSTLSKAYGNKIPQIIKALNNKKIKFSGDNVQLTLDNEILNLTKEDILVEYHGKDGQHILSDKGIVVALDLKITEELLKEGIARDIVRQIQDARKQLGFEITDNIKIFLKGNYPAEWLNYICKETLSSFEEFNEARFSEKIDTQNGIIEIKIK